MAIETRWGAATHRGLVRAGNEDAVLAGPTIFAVADGMGGHVGGEIASALTVSELSNVDGVARPDDVLAALERANAAIRERGGADGMGTTVAGLTIAGNDVVVFNIGDSRVYRLGGDDFEQLSLDHSVVGELLRDGTITRDEARHHPQRNVITRALGLGAMFEAHVLCLPAEPGDRYLVCSDGLFNELADDELEAELRLAAGDGWEEALAQGFLARALEEGGQDNISVVVVALVGHGGAADELDADTNPRVAVASAEGRSA